MGVSSLRHFVLIAFFGALAALEIAHGVFRVRVLRGRHREEVLARTEGEVAELSSRLRTFVAGGREHATYLARTPGARELLSAEAAAHAEEARARLERQLLPYLLSFRGIDRLRVLAGSGAERFRCERIGSGVGSIPAPLLAAAPASGEMPAWPGSVPAGTVAVSDLVVDLARVEVPREDRRVLHYVTPVALGGGAEDGAVVVTIYASPILDLVREFRPVSDGYSMLVDGRGAFLAHADRSLEVVGDGPAPFSTTFPGVRLAPVDGVRRIERPDGVLFESTIRESPLWTLVAFVPSSSADFAASHVRGEYVWVVGSMVAVTAMLAIAAVVFVRWSMRSVRLAEERREDELQRKVRHSERMSSLGLLTAGVAHEINNPLEGVTNYLSLLEREPLDPDERRRYVERIRRGVHRIRDIVKDLSSFSRPARDADSAGVATVVRNALSMVGYSREFRDIRVELDGLDDAPLVTCDPGRLEQVFLNLLHNASRAMDGEGSIRISAAREKTAGGGAMERLVIRVEDDGPGFEEGSLEHVFDPFYTTGEGSGLGLWISYGIIRAYGGTLEAGNRETGGAVLTIRLAVERGSLDTREDRREATLG